MRVSVIVPFRTDNGIRGDIWNWIEARWRNVHADFELCIADSTAEEFNRSEARNNAFAESTGDIIVVADADSVPMPLTLLGCVEMVAKDNDIWMIAHDRYLMLNEASTLGLMQESPSVRIVPPPSEALVRPPFVSYAGMLVMHRSAYEEAGGYDEGFDGWGLEDWAFRTTLDTIKQPLQRLPGALVHLYHGPPKGDSFGEPPSDYNLRLYSEYERASGDPDAMRALIGGRDA